jgi:hypothetical protein
MASSSVLENNKDNPEKFSFAISLLLAVVAVHAGRRAATRG